MLKGILKTKGEQMTEFENIGNALNVLSESEDFREIFSEIPDSFWQIVFSKRNPQLKAPPQSPP